MNSSSKRQGVRDGAHGTDRMQDGVAGGRAVGRREQGEKQIRLTYVRT